MPYIRNLLNGVLHFGFRILFKKWEKGEKKMILFWGKTEEKQNVATIMISVDGKGQFFQWSWNYKGNRLNKRIKKEKFLKNLINLTERNHQINMTSDHSVSNNNSFKTQEFKS